MFCFLEGDHFGICKGGFLGGDEGFETVDFLVGGGYGGGGSRGGGRVEGWVEG